jgi:hypothetical protein
LPGKICGRMLAGRRDRLSLKKFGQEAAGARRRGRLSSALHDAMVDPALRRLAGGSRLRQLQTCRRDGRLACPWAARWPRRLMRTVGTAQFRPRPIEPVPNRMLVFWLVHRAISSDDRERNRETPAAMRFPASHSHRARCRLSPLQWSGELGPLTVRLTVFFGPVGVNPLCSVACAGLVDNRAEFIRPVTSPTGAAPKWASDTLDVKETLSRDAQIACPREFMGGAMVDTIGWLTVATAVALVTAQIAFLIHL